MSRPTSPSTDDPEAFKSYFRPHSEVLSDISEAPETELRQTLKERHVNMIGFSTVLGVGLFLSAGEAIFLAGPGGAVLAYLVVGTIVWSVMACMGEMTALFPVKGPVFEFPRRFIDESVGLATGWIIWFSWVTIAAAEILSITGLFHFKFDPAYLAEVGYPRPTLEWSTGLTTNPGVWVGIFLVIILLVNLLPVRQYGRMEYIFGCSKIIVLVILIMFNIIVNARHLYTADRFWTYETPYGFSSQNMTVIPSSGPGDDGLVYTGTLGQFTAFFSAMCTTIFSILGWEVILFTAPENADLKRTETMKISSRKIALRVILLYALATFTVGLNVPYTDPNLVNLTVNGIGGGNASAFIISAVRNHVLYLPHILNGFYIFSACSTGINALYSASRTLHALASIPDAWPTWGPVEAVRSRLERTTFGVPMCAVFVSWLVGFLAFLSTKTVESATLGRIADVTVVGSLIVYSMNCAAYLQFYRAINDAAEGKLDEDLNLTPEMRNLYKRTAKRYPYRSHLQWMRAVYGFTACMIFAIFQGWRTFIPLSVKDFIAAYIAFALFVVLSLLYFFASRGFSPRNWRIRANMLFGLESVGPIAVDSEKLTVPCDFCGAKHRRGHLVFPDSNLITSGNMRALIEWIWVWLK